MMIEVDLIRHAKVSGKPALYGKTDVLPIALENERLLNCLYKKHLLTPYTKVTTSPLARCRLVAERFAQQSNLFIKVIPGFQEMNFGVYDGVAFDDLPVSNTAKVSEEQSKQLVSQENTTENKAEVLSWQKMEAFFNEPAKNDLPNAESLASFQQRVVNTWKIFVEQQMRLVVESSLKQNAEAVHISSDINSARIALISHGGVIRIILAHILQLDWQSPALYQKLTIANASLSRIRITLPIPEKNIIADQQIYKDFHQQVTTIAMPLFEGV